jgi:hypothetical protein
MGLKYILVLTFSLSLIPSILSAQDNSDSVTVIKEFQDSLIVESDEVIEIVIDTLENRPNTASLYSAALPGLGQAYNKKYWKIPLIYGGGLVMGYFLNYNHQLYTQYRDGLIAIIDQDDRTQPFDPILSEKTYQRAVDYWRRNRDLLMIGVVFLYVMTIVDAHVDAHLELFTIEDDISLNLEPSFDQTAMQTSIFGLSLKLKFN